MTDGPRAAVLGGGIAGVATAWYLARGGYRVTVVERREGAGLETSFANGGLITPSMSDPWASPGIPMLILKWLGREDAPFLLRLRALPGLFSWGLEFLRQCNDDDWHRNTRNILRLCTYSHACLHELAREAGVDYESNPRGTLRLFRDSLSMEKSSRVAETLRELGVRLTTLDSAACIELEPALRGQADRIAGAIHYPTTRRVTPTSLPGVWPKRVRRRGSSSGTARPSNRSRPARARSPASGPTPGASKPMSVSSRWAPIRPRGCARTVSVFRSTRSRATR